MKKFEQAFTLIELMIVVSIIGILSVIVIPTYQDYVIRTQVSEGMNLADDIKTAVTQFFQDRGTWPINNTEVGLSIPTNIEGKYVLAIEVVNNIITVTYGNGAHVKIAGQKITMTAIESNGSISWTCANGGVIADNHLPAACR
jgi:type IV pilus assembly protein PilA